MTRTVHCLLLAAACLAAWAGHATTANAATFWWNGTINGTSPWGTWSTSPSSVVVSGSVTAADDAVFNIDANNGGGSTVSLGGNNQAANSLLFSTTGATFFVRASGTSASSSNLTIGTGGITLSSTAGAVTISATDRIINVRVNGSSLPITNNSPSLLTFGTGVQPATAFSGLSTISIAGSGTGGVNFAGGINNNAGTGTTALVVNTAATSKTSIGTSGNFTGGTTLTEGIIGLGSSTALGTGTITINGGALASESQARTLTNNIVVGGNFTLGGLQNSITLNGTVDLSNANRTITLKNSGTFGGVVSNGGLTLAATGGQRLLLIGNNTYALGSTVNSGTLMAGSATAFGTGNLAVNGGGVDLNGQTMTVAALSGSSGAVIASGSAATLVLTSSAATDSTYAGSILNGSGTVAFTKAGSGRLTFSGSNGYTGATTVSAGVLQLGNANALGAGAVTVASGATLDVRAAVTNNVITNSGTVSVGPGGNLSTNAIAGSGEVTLGGVSGTTATLTSTLTSGTLTLASLSATGNTNVSFAAGTKIVTTGALNFSGASNLITLSGAVITSSGTVDLITGSTLSGTSGLSLTGSAVGNATLGLGSTTTVGRTTYQFNPTASALQLLVNGTTFNLTWDNAIASGTWNVAGAASWLQDNTPPPTTFYDFDNVTFGSAATVNVPSAVTTGAMVISNTSGSVALSGAGVINATTLSKSGAGSATIANSGTVTGGVTVNAGSFTTNGPLSVTAGGFSVASGGTATLGAAGTVAGGITVNGGRLTLDAAQAVSGAVSVSNSGVLVLNSGSLGTGALTLDNGTLSEGVAATGIGNAVTVGAGGATVNNDTPFELSGAITGSSNVLTKTGAGLLTMTGAVGSNGSGVVLNVNSGTVAFTSANTNRALASSTINGAIALSSGSLTLGGNLAGTGLLATSGTATVRADASSVSGTKEISVPTTLDGLITLAPNAGRRLLFTGSLAGSGTATTTGNDWIAIKSATSTFAGTLIVNHSGQPNGYTEVTTQALGNAASVVVNPNSSRVGNYNLFVNNTSTGTFAGVVSGSGMVYIAGSAKATLTGSNTYSGGTQLNGDVGVTNGSALGSGTITSVGASARVLWDGAGTTVTISNALSTGTTGSRVLAFAPGSGKTIVLTGAVTGSGQLKVSGGGDLDITGLAANTNAGGIEVGTGRIITNLANLGGGAINFGTGSNSFLVATASGTITNAITIGNSSGAGYMANVDTNGQNVTLSSSITQSGTTTAQAGRLTKLGVGTLTLSASNGYAGVTSVAAGTLRAGHASAFGTGTVTVDGGTLDLDSLGVGNSLTLASGSLFNAANYGGTQTVSGTFSYAPGTVGGTVNTVSGGVLKGSGVTFTGPATFASGAIHAPGNSPGTQTFAGGLAYEATSTLQWELIASTTASPGVNYDSISVTGGSLSIDTSALMQLVFNGAGSTVNWNDSFWNSNRTWTVIGVGEALTSSGIFALLGDASTWLDSNSASLASVKGADANFSLDNSSGSILLNYTIVAVPEPSTLALMGVGLAVVAGRLTRRRRV